MKTFDFKTQRHGAAVSTRRFVKQLQAAGLVVWIVNAGSKVAVETTSTKEIEKTFEIAVDNNFELC